MLIRKAGIKIISGFRANNSIFVPGSARLPGPVPAAGCRAGHFSIFYFVFSRSSPAPGPGAGSPAPGPAKILIYLFVLF